MKGFLFFLLIFINLNSFALDIGDQLNVNILEYYPHNIIMLNRGMDDGIEVSDHAQLRNVDGYAARAVCLKTKLSTSYWKIYRLVDKDLISKDFTYKLISINQKEIDRHIKKNNTDEFHHHIKEKAEPAPVQKAVQNDLPESVNEYDSKIFEAEKPLTFWEENINHELLKRELSKFDTEVYLSPYSRQSINNSQTLHYGLKLQNGGKKYSAYGGLDVYRAKMQDAETEKAVISENKQAHIGFEVKKMTPEWSAFTQTNYSKIRYGQLRTPKDLYLIGLIGFKRHLRENKIWKTAHLSYIPLLEKRTMEYRHTTLTDSSIRSNSSSGLRHGFRFMAEIHLAEKLLLTDTVWWRPYQDLATWGIDFGNNMTQNEMRLSYELASKFYLDYSFVYLDDKFLREDSNISRSNSINSLEFRYHFEL